jgi:hypothetical protein
MLKNLLILGLMTWMSLSYAKGDAVVRDSIGDAESYKVEKPVTEQEAKRSLAGSKIKKKKVSEVQGDAPQKNEEESQLDTEIRYWQYSE